MDAKRRPMDWQAAWRWMNRYVGQLQARAERGDFELPSPALLAEIMRASYEAGWEHCREQCMAQVEVILADPLNATYVFEIPKCAHCESRQVTWINGHLDWADEEHDYVPVGTVERFHCDACGRFFEVREPIVVPPIEGDDESEGTGHEPR